MRLCINTCSIGAEPRGPWPIPAQLRAAAASPFSSVGIDIQTITPFKQRGGSVKQIRSLLDDAELECLEIHVLRCFPAGRKTIDPVEVERWATISRALGARWVNVTIDAQPTTSTISELKTAARRLNDSGAGVSIEYQPGYACDSVSSALAWVDALNGFDVGIQIDTWHTFRGSTTLADIASLHADAVSFVQFGDGTAVTEPANGRLLPGDGEFDLPGFVKAVRRTGFDGEVQVETFVPALMTGDPLEAAVRQFATCAPYWGMTELHEESQ